MSDLRQQLEEGLASRYTIARELGRGGMATVYLAHDLRHDRDVALKVLHPELAYALGPERFQREIRLAARLQHAHILTVLDSGEVGGPEGREGREAEESGPTTHDPRLKTLYYTMPYVEGESLRARLDRERQLPLDEAIRIAREAAQALQYAHDHGVIHRDIKPENILLAEDGSTLVADFGIARTISASDAKLTETGMTIGTPAYMSPEQASGEQELTARSDVYSLGTVVYEMLAGDVPFTGATPQAVIARRFSGEVPDVRRSRSSVPEPVAAAVARALAMVPADRWSSAAEFSRALSVQTAPITTPVQPVAPAQPVASARRLSPALSMLLLGLIVGAGLLFAWRTRGPSVVGGTRLIAVLPFENLGDSTDTYFAEGIADEVRNKLGVVPGVEVIARASSMPYKATRLTPTQIADELGVHYLLTGTVRRVKSGTGEQVLVRPELVEIAEGGAPRARWGESIDVPLADVFQMQSEIAAEVVHALGVAFGAEAREQIDAAPTTNLAAYDSYLKGEAIAGVSDPAALRRALEHYERAVALDPRFAVAWARVSTMHTQLYLNSTPTPAGAAAAREAAERARALAPDLPEAYAAMGRYLGQVQGDAAGAAELYRAGLARAPAHAGLLTAAAINAQALGQWDSVVVLLERATEVDPRSVESARRLARAYLWLRRYDEAEAASRRAQTLAPTNLTVLEEHAMVSLARGDLASARAVIASVPEQVPQTDVVAYLSSFWDLGWVLDERQRDLLLRLGPRAFGDDPALRAMVFADAYRLRGDTRRAAAYGDTAAREFTKQLADVPNDAQRIVLRALASATAGQTAAAIAEGERGAALTPLEQNGFIGTYNHHQLARIYLIAGQPEKALDLIERLLRVPYYLSPGWLRIDPQFQSLRGNPRFERLIASRS